jgi:hypothetical protein
MIGLVRGAHKRGVSPFVSQGSNKGASSKEETPFQKQV